MLGIGIARGACLITLAPAACFAPLFPGLPPAAPPHLTAPSATGPRDAGAVARAATPRASANPPVPRIQCRTPHTLRLRRFEDLSAQLLCDRRLIVRISVPG